MKICTRRTGALAIAAVVVLSLPSAPTASAASNGSRCSKAGAVSRQGATRLRCTKVGKQLLWRNITPARPKPGPQAGPDPMIGTACDEPGHELLNEAGPIRCSGGVWAVIARTDDSVASRAYRNLMAQYWANPASTVELRIVTDTQTAYAVGALERGMRAADRLWSVKSQLQPYPVVVAHSLDSLVTQTEGLGLVVSEWSVSTLLQQEETYGACGLGTFNKRVRQPWLFFCFGERPSDDNAPSVAFGNIGAHEFTHLAQYALMDDVQGWRTNLRMAPWFEEGLASYIMMALGAVGGAEGDLRKHWVSGLESTTATLADFNYRYPVVRNGDVYSLGLFANEALSALEGTRIAERLLRACGTGLKFSAAMEKVTGHTLEAWTPILTAYVETVMAGKPLTVVELEGLRRSTFAK